MSHVSAAPRQKAPRRTAERILDAALDLFNRYGEPNTATAMIAAELSISTGNLYYHYPAKEALVNALAERFETAMQDILPQAGQVTDLAGAGAYLHTLYSLIWQYRFLYRDLNDLLTRNRPLEQQYRRTLDRQRAALCLLLERLQAAGALRAQPDDARERLATTLLLVLTHWFNHEYALDPHHALEPANEAGAIQRGETQLVSLLEQLVPC